MPSTIALSAADRKALLDLYRHGPDPHVARRAHLLLLLAAGYLANGNPFEIEGSVYPAPKVA
jgi:hypothetical protein